MRHIEKHRTSRIGWLRAGGVSVITRVKRVSFWGTLPMALTAAVGALFGFMTVLLGDDQKWMHSLDVIPTLHTTLYDITHIKKQYRAAARTHSYLRG